MVWEDEGWTGESSSVSVMVGKRGRESNKRLHFILQRERKNKTVRLWFFVYNAVT